MRKHSGTVGHCQSTGAVLTWQPSHVNFSGSTWALSAAMAKGRCHGRAKLRPQKTYVLMLWSRSWRTIARSGRQTSP